MAASKNGKASPDELRRAVKDQPLITLTGAAKLLGIAPPNVSRLRKAGRFPEPIAVEGGAPVYARSEVEALKRELAEGRS